MDANPQSSRESCAGLPASLEPLTEQLADKVHQQWMALRMKEGWRYGPRRDDERKEHPCLVPYDQLPDSEKEYDRATVTQTLSTILALGYRIEKA